MDKKAIPLPKPPIFLSSLLLYTDELGDILNFTSESIAGSWFIVCDLGDVVEGTDEVGCL